MVAQKTTSISDLFNVGYGTKLDLKQMRLVSPYDPSGIRFVSRSSKNLGVVARVERYRDVEPIPAGTITVALGGTNLLCAFIQDEPFYTAQNIAVITPKIDMTRDIKLFYCLCLSRNRFKYSAFGREANKTLKSIQVPSDPPEWLQYVNKSLDNIAEQPLSKMIVNLHERQWKYFRYSELFTIRKGKRIVNNDVLPGSTPCIRPIEFNNGVADYISLPPNQGGNTITVSYNGSVGEAFYQPQPYFAVDDINVLCSKFAMNPFKAMFLITLIRKEKYRYSFGRKWNVKRMRNSVVYLPVTNTGEPDYQFMENYIKSLPYSANLAIVEKL